MRLCIRGGQSQNFASHEFKLGNYQKFLSLLPDKRLSFLTHFCDCPPLICHLSLEKFTHRSLENTYTQKDQAHETPYKGWTIAEF